MQLQANTLLRLTRHPKDGPIKVRAVGRNDRLAAVLLEEEYAGQYRVVSVGRNEAKIYPHAGNAQTTIYGCEPKDFFPIELDGYPRRPVPLGPADLTFKALRARGTVRIELDARSGVTDRFAECSIYGTNERFRLEDFALIPLSDKVYVAAVTEHPKALEGATYEHLLRVGQIDLAAFMQIFTEREIMHQIMFA